MVEIQTEHNEEAYCTVADNNIFRLLLSLPRRTSASQLFARHNVHNCNMILRKQMYGFINRLDQFDNEIIMLGSSFECVSKLRQH